MKYHSRTLEKELLKAWKSFPAVLLTGPRRSGKSTLLRQAFPDANYVLLEDLDVIARVKADPRGFVEELRTPVILDEIQNAPQLFNYIRTLIDGSPRKKGQWAFTGSQEAPLMRGVSESMAGRVAIFQLLPFSLQESSKVSLLKGGFPEVIERPSTRSTWFRSYVQTYLERDIRSMSAIRDLSTFRRFMALLSSRTGQILNKTDFASSLGVSIPTITDWLSLLETTAQIMLVPPFYANFGKRLTKSPKLYFSDTGLACHLLGIETASELAKSPFRGPLFENFVASEIAKIQLHRNQSRNLYHFRDQLGLEVDFIVPEPKSEKLVLLECKASRTLKPDMAKPLQTLARSISKRSLKKGIVHPSGKIPSSTDVVAPGVKAITENQLAEFI